MKDRREHYCNNCKCKTIQHSDIQYVESASDYIRVWICGNCGTVTPRRVTSPRASRIPGYQTPSQKAAIEFLRHHIEKDLDEDESRGDQITRFETTSNEYDGSLWLVVETEMLGLSKNSMLRFLEHDHWHFLIGRGGKIEAHSYPDSYKQFKGQKVFQHIHVK